MKFMDFFSGIGGFRSGLEKNGHECMAFCEIDKYARQSYKAIYNTENEVEYHDITTISNNDFRAFRGEIDIIAGGFPCQAFSIAGKRRGFEDTRGTLFFDIARAIKEIQPSYALLENVKGLFSHDQGRTFGTIIQALDELGYVVEWGLFNSKYWGVPQNRERVFILATRKDVFKQPKLINLLNKQTEVNTRLLDLIEDEVDEKYYLSGEKAEKLTAMIDEKYDIKERVVVDATINEPKVKEVMNTVISRYDSGVSNYKSTGGMVIEPTIPIKEATKKGYAEAHEGDSVNYQFPDSETRRGRVGKQVANTLEASGVNQGVVTSDLKIRKLTPLECWRLQGFTDEQFYKAKNDGVSNSQLYKQAGNSVTVNVIDAIVKEIGG